MEYDVVQEELVVDCEKAHLGGIRGTGLSGSVCETLLKEVLAPQFPKYGLGSGTMILEPDKLADLRSPRKGIVSPQIDIIVYRDEPYYSLGGVISVKRQSALLSIEVKKWVSVGRLHSINQQVSRIRDAIEKPVFLVAFRHFGEIDELKRISSADKTFLFSKATPNQYPWDIDTQEWIHRGELKSLIEEINTRLNQAFK